MNVKYVHNILYMVVLLIRIVFFSSHFLDIDPHLNKDTLSIEAKQLINKETDKYKYRHKVYNIQQKFF